MTTEGEKFQILALDGGGIKGLFSAAVLAHLEKDLSTQITQHFDLITGTSTGGIIALGLGYGLSPKDIVKFYVEEGPKIFRTTPLASWKNIFCCKYDNQPLKECLIACFQDAILGDSSIRLVIPSYNINEDDVYLFKTPHNKRLRRDWKVPMWKVAMATSAAPTFFPVFSGVDSIRLVDGGVWANNPTMVGIIEAINLLEIDYKSIRVLNLGTTDPLKGRPASLNRGGLWSWKKQAIDVALRGQSLGAYTHAKLLLGEDKIFRLDPPVPDGLFELDKLSTDALMSKAAHCSRQLAPHFEKMFLNHTPTPYQPYYTIRGEENA